MSMPDVSSNSGLSLWHSNCPGISLPALEEEIDADVAILGAGFTGLWTAYYLKKLDPSLSIAVVEAHFPGFGASGRNGGWAVGEMAGMATRFADPATRDSAILLQRAMFDTVDEIGRVTKEEGIDCHYAKGGQINLATAPLYEAHLREEAEHWSALGFGKEDFCWLEANEVVRHVRRPGPVVVVLSSRLCSARCSSRILSLSPHHLFFIKS